MMNGFPEHCIAIEEGVGRHSSTEGIGHATIHDQSAGGDCFLRSREDAMAHTLGFLLIAEIVADEDLVAHPIPLSS